jgi:hypothetical protein
MRNLLFNKAAFHKFIFYFSIVLSFFLVFIASALKHSIEGGKKFIQPAFNKNVLNSYEPQTGDIIMMHYLSHGMIGIPVAEHWPTHAAFVWVKNDGKAYILECTKFSAPALPNVLEHTKDKERGVRCVPFDEFVNSVDNVMYIRKLKKGFISSNAVYDLIEKWGKYIDFETRIADSMTFDLTVAIGFVPVWPKLGEWCARTAKLNDLERRKDRAFCSEFVSQLLQKLGATDLNFKEHYRMSPASFLSSVGALEKIANKNFAWKKDRMLVRRIN